jgi:hypothetical protein
MVPSWISTHFNGGVVAELQDMPEPSLELGTIIDGITDIGFRNVLNSARRGHAVKLPLHLLTPVTPATGASSDPGPSPIAAANAAPMRVTPAASPQASAPLSPPNSSSPSPFGLPVAPAELANPFAVVPQSPLAPTAPEPAAATLKVEPGNPFASVPDAPPPEPQSPFTFPAPPSTAVPTLLQPNVSLQDLFGKGQATEEPQPRPTGTAMESEMATAITPPPSPQPAPAPAPATTPSQAFSFASAAFDPFAPTEGSQPTTGGFSSFDLLGGGPSATEPTPSPEPEVIKTTSQAPPPTAFFSEPRVEPAIRIEPTPESEPEPKTETVAFAPPALFAESETETESELKMEIATEPAVVPEIPFTAELTEVVPPILPSSSSAPKISTWPDIDPIPTPPPVPATHLAPAPTAPIAFKPLFVEKAPPVSVAPVLDFSPPEKTAPSTPSPVPTSAPAMPTLSPLPRGIAPARTSLGLSALERTGEEQLLLRALLDTDEELTLERVIDMTSQLPGIAACALVRGSEVIAGSSTKGSDAKAFRSQAAEVAKSLRTLAPLIGISDAETFTLNTDSRLITLCFPGEVTLALLHDREPTLGLRDKLTLIARQLDSMVSKR